MVSLPFLSSLQIFSFCKHLLHSALKMKGAVILISCLVAVMAAQSALAAFIQVPDEYLVDSEVSLVGESYPREKRDVQIEGAGSNKQGFISAQGQKNLYTDPKTSVDAALSASSQWMKGVPTQNAGSARLDVTRNLYDSGKTRLDASGSFQRDVATGMKPFDSGHLRLDAQRNLYSSPSTQVNANAFAQRNMASGSRPHDSFGAGLEVSRNLARGRHGSLDAFAGYQRQWNTPSRHNANAGIRWNF